MNTFDASDILTGSVDLLKDEAGTIVPLALGVGVILLAVRRGWGYVKGFSK